MNPIELMFHKNLKNFFEKLGVVNGYKEPDGSGKCPFYPDVPASNIQIAAFLMRCAQLDNSLQPAMLMAEPAANSKPTLDVITQGLIDQLTTQFGKNSEIVKLASANPNAPGTQKNLNRISGSLAPEQPTISVSNDGQVTITTEDGATIYYTTNNGDTPTVNSTLYTAAFALDGFSTIKAVAVKNSLYSGVATYTKQEQPTLSISPSATSLNGSGTITLTTSKAADSEICSDSNITVSGSDTTWTATLPNATATYTFTAKAGTETADCTGAVTYQGSGSTGGSSSGGSSSSGVTGSGDNVSVSASGGSVTSAQMDKAVDLADRGEAITVDAGRSNTVSLPVSGLESAAENDNSLAARRGAPVPGGPCFRGGAGRAQRHHRCGAGGH